VPGRAAQHAAVHAAQVMPGAQRSAVALEAMSESLLRMELAPDGVPVCVVEPGQTATAILEKAAAELADLERASAT
jgi:NAD(P)-dependent dehydrogenase (short-subunit alcohol dehydrogenase family)